MRDLDDAALERRLRGVLKEHLGALPLDLTVDALDRRREAKGRCPTVGRSRGMTLLAAAALLLVGGALAAGSGVLRRQRSSRRCLPHPWPGRRRIAGCDTEPEQVDYGQPEPDGCADRLDRGESEPGLARRRSAANPPDSRSSCRRRSRAPSRRSDGRHGIRRGALEGHRQRGHWPLRGGVVDRPRLGPQIRRGMEACGGVDPRQVWYAYGVVVDTDGDGVADYRYGIDNVPVGTQRGGYYPVKGPIQRPASGGPTFTPVGLIGCSPTNSSDRPPTGSRRPIRPAGVHLPEYARGECGQHISVR